MQTVADQLLLMQCVVDRSRIRITTKSKVPNLAGDRDIILRPGAGTPDGAAVLGGGRITTFERRTLNVTLRTRNALDQVASDSNWLLDDDGHLAFEDQVIDALQINYPIVSQLAVYKEPMRYMGVSEPRTNENKWGESIVQFEIKYLRSLDQSRQ